MPYSRTFIRGAVIGSTVGCAFALIATFVVDKTVPLLVALLISIPFIAAIAFTVEWVASRKELQSLERASLKISPEQGKE